VKISEKDISNLEMNYLFSLFVPHVLLIISSHGATCSINQNIYASALTTLTGVIRSDQSCTNTVAAGKIRSLKLSGTHGLQTNKTGEDYQTLISDFCSQTGLSNMVLNTEGVPYDEITLEEMLPDCANSNFKVCKIQCPVGQIVNEKTIESVSPACDSGAFSIVTAGVIETITATMVDSEGVETILPSYDALRIGAVPTPKPTTPTKSPTTGKVSILKFSM